MDRSNRKIWSLLLAKSAYLSMKTESKFTVKNQSFHVLLRTEFFAIAAVSQSETAGIDR